MAITEKMWDAIATVIRMNDKIETLQNTVKLQQDKIENLTERLIRLETVIEIAREANAAAPRRIDTDK
jgi:uncharacterized coiled-coil protein SlyX